MRYQISLPKTTIKVVKKLIRKSKISRGSRTPNTKGKFIQANVKLVKNVEKYFDKPSNKSYKLTINEINSFSSINLKFPLKKKQQIDDQTILLEKKIAECFINSDTEGDSDSLICKDELSLIEENTVQIANQSWFNAQMQTQFLKKHIQIESGKEEDFLSQILKIEREYNIYKEYLENYQPKQLNWNMRAILIDWLFEVAEDFKLKRDTVYNAISLLDRFFQRRSPIIKKENLQAIGITALNITAKAEEIHPPKLQKLIDLCGGQYTLNQILDFELIILQKTSWKIQPITCNFWLNFIAFQWDDFLACETKKSNLFIENNDFFLFLNKTADSFINYRILCNYVDAIQLDLSSVAFQSHILVSSFIYIIIKTNFESLQLCKRCPPLEEESTTFNGQKKREIDEIFNEFLMRKMKTNFDEMSTVMQYSSKYLNLPMNFQMSSENFDKTVTFDFKKNYGYNISFQTYNEKSLEFVQNLGNP